MEVFKSYDFKLAERFNRFRFQKRFFDVKLRVKHLSHDHIFDAHRVLLGAVFEYFDQLFMDEENLKPEVEINEEWLTAEAFKCFLEYAYTGSLSIRDTNLAKEICIAAHHMKVTQLLSFGEIYLYTHINENTILELTLFAHKYSLTRLSARCSAFFSINPSLINVDSNYLNFDEKDMLVFLEAIKKTPNAEEIYKIVSKWIQHDVENRKEHLSGMINFIPLDLLNESFIDNTVLQDSIFLNDLTFLQMLLRLSMKKINFLLNTKASSFKDAVEVKAPEVMLKPLDSFCFKFQKDPKELGFFGSKCLGEKGEVVNNAASLFEPSKTPPKA